MEDKKICVITGCNSGIGKVTAIQLAKMDYKIVMLVRDSDKSRAAFNEIKTNSNSDDIKMYFVDLSSQQSISNVVDKIKSEYSKIDVLINNAGVFKRKQEFSSDGEELTFAVNYIAPFLLTNLLLPLIEKSSEGRIINLTSELYKKGKVDLNNLSLKGEFNGDKAYANSKLLIVYFTQELSKRLKENNITVNCVHPGVVGTAVFREYPKWYSALLNIFISKPEDGAKPEIYLASSPGVYNLTGRYFYKTKMKPVTAVANDEKLSQQIWKLSEKMTNINKK